jgi:uncharacterized protein YndB with AHSA1/START domain
VRRREYRFLTTWLLASPREPVYELIWDSAGWPDWWPGVIEAAELEPGDSATGLGRRGRYEWRSTIPYPVRFEVVTTRVEPPHLLEGAASGGLEGTGRWRLFEADGGPGDSLTAVTYEWNVCTPKLWMNLLAPVAAPVFRWNHDRIMSAGGRGLAQRLATRLVAST